MFLIVNALPDILKSLGFDTAPNILIQGNANTIVNPKSSDKYFESNHINWETNLDIIKSGITRLTFHIIKLRNGAIINLLTGITIAAIGVYFLYEAINAVDDIAKKMVDLKVLTIFSSILPRLAVALFIQIFAYFFLAMYKSNQDEIRFFQNEITNLEAKLTAYLLAKEVNAKDSMKVALDAMARTERNRVLKKGERNMLEPREIEILKELNAASKAQKLNISLLTDTQQKK